MDLGSRLPRLVFCPTCGASPGQNCNGRRPGGRVSCHQERVRWARALDGVEEAERVIVSRSAYMDDLKREKRNAAALGRNG